MADFPGYPATTSRSDATVAATNHAADHDLIAVAVNWLDGQQGAPLGLPGATGATRFAGATTSGAPTTGTFTVGDFIIDRGVGHIWVCTTAGTPGTWVDSGAAGAVDGAAGVATLRTLGVNSTQAAPGDLALTTTGDIPIRGTVGNRTRLGVTGTAGYVLTEDPTDPNKIGWRAPAGGTFLVTNYGDLSTPTASTTTFTAAVTAAAVKGGTVVLPAAGIDINGPIIIPDGVALVGAAAYVQGHTGSQIRTTGSTARIDFEGYGGWSGNFVIDGTAGGATSGLLYVGFLDGRAFGPITVFKAPGDGVLIESTQNSSFDQLGVYEAVRDGVVLDKGCGGLTFHRIEVAASGRDGVSVKGNTAPAGAFTYPQHIKFDVGDIEYSNTASGTYRNCLRMARGDEILFDMVHFGATTGNGTDTDGQGQGYILNLQNSWVTFRDCNLSGNNQTTGAGLIYAKNQTIYLTGTNRVYFAPKIFTFDTSVVGRVDQYLAYQMVTEFTLLNGAVAFSPPPQAKLSAFVNAVSGVFTFDFTNFDMLLGVVSGNSTCANLTNGRTYGDEVTVGFIRSAAGTLTWPSNVYFADGTPPALSATANHFMFVTFRWIGGWYEKTRSAA